MIPFIVFGGLTVLLLVFFGIYLRILAAEDRRCNEPWAPGTVAASTRLELLRQGTVTAQFLEYAAAVLDG